MARLLIGDIKADRSRAAPAPSHAASGGGGGGGLGEQTETVRCEAVGRWDEIQLG